MKIQDRGLLLRAADQDNTAVRELWNIWSPRLSLYFRGTLSAEDVEDLVQETMLKVFRSLSTYNPAYSPSTWIYTIASRCRTDWLRRSGRQPWTFPEGEDENEITNLRGSYPDPENNFIQNESRNAVQDFIRSRDSRDREILYLFCYEDLSGRRIAKVMNLPPETVRYRLKILKQKLKKELSI